METGGVTVEPEITRLRPLLTGVVDLWESQAAARGIAVRMDLSGCAELVLCDPRLVRQITFNLLSNAVKFTQQGEVRLVASSKAGQLSIAVADTGIGIAPDLLPTIFELFRQGTQSLDRTRGGLGIGLTVAKRLVEMHGGHITAHSDGVGRGTEVTLWLPTATTVGEATSSATNTPTPGRARRVLVVDDNADGADMIAMGLATTKNEVKTACDGVAAMAIARAWKPDVVLLDIGLPGMDGFEVARRLRALPEGEQISIIATTGYGDERTRERSRLAGFDLHLVKPVSIEALARAVSAPR
jgi:CheY-like chemotaxis protein